MCSCEKNILLSDDSHSHLSSSPIPSLQSSTCDGLFDDCKTEPGGSSDECKTETETESDETSDEDDSETGTDETSDEDEGEPPVLYMHFNEPKLRITIAYQEYKQNSPKKGKNIKFAGSIFRPDDRRGKSKSAYVEANHRKTALARLKTRPLWADFGLGSFLRRQIHNRGVRGKGPRAKN